MPELSEEILARLKEGLENKSAWGAVIIRKTEVEREGQDAVRRSQRLIEGIQEYLNGRAGYYSTVLEGDKEFHILYWS
jgi:hypothetical protein|tara:strand:+ start:757 stop:990 length:234 start_codon:yes stop_codon:yes gene_type:complete